MDTYRLGRQQSRREAGQHALGGHLLTHHQQLQDAQLHLASGLGQLVAHPGPVDEAQRLGRVLQQLGAYVVERTAGGHRQHRAKTGGAQGERPRLWGGGARGPPGEGIGCRGQCAAQGITDHHIRVHGGRQPVHDPLHRVRVRVQVGEPVRKPVQQRGELIGVPFGLPVAVLAQPRYQFLPVAQRLRRGEQRHAEADGRAADHHRNGLRAVLLDHHGETGGPPTGQLTQQRPDLLVHGRPPGIPEVTDHHQGVPDVTQRAARGRGQGQGAYGIDRAVGRRTPVDESKTEVGLLAQVVQRGHGVLPVSMAHRPLSTP